MGWIFALASRDPNLVGCALHMLQVPRPLRPTSEPAVYGLGYYQAGEPLLERQPTARAGYNVRSLAENLESEIFLTHARGPGFPAKDENTQPYRFRRWLFAHSGRVEEFARVKLALQRALPDFWQRQLKGDTDSEILALYLLRRLRDRGLLDEADAPSVAFGRAVKEALEDVEAVLREQGVARQSPLTCAITNGRSLAVARVGSPLSYRLIEGLMPCIRCGLDDKTPELHPSLRPHRRMRAVAFVSEEASAGQVEVPDRTVIVISPSLELRSEPL